MKKASQGSWVWRGQRHGKRKEIGLGSAKDVKLAMSRDMAAKIRLAIVEGRDPLEAIGRGSEASAKDWTLAAVVDRTFESLKGEGTAEPWMSPRSLHVLPKLGKRSVEGIDAEDIRATSSPIWSIEPAAAE